MAQGLPRWAAASVVAMLVAVFATAAGCLTTAPPGIATAPPPRPTILQNSVTPPADQLLVDWPSDDTFEVPVQLQDPQETFEYDVFVDYAAAYAIAIEQGETNPNPYPEIPPVPVSTGANNAGIVIVTFPLPVPAPSTSCHTIEFLVVNQFAQLEGGTPLYHVPNAAGSDSVIWFYAPGGSLDGCPVYDAGIFEDGATPSDGAANDVGAPPADGPAPAEADDP